jgi:hypothetical protein
LNLTAFTEAQVLIRRLELLQALKGQLTDVPDVNSYGIELRHIDDKGLHRTQLYIQTHDPNAPIGVAEFIALLQELCDKAIADMQRELQRIGVTIET